VINGVVVGIVVDNVDPDGMHRVLVSYPVAHSDEIKTSWCRMITPMAGQDRGLVMLPDVDTEVILGFAYRTLTPYVLGAVYNLGEDLPAPYANEDGNNDHRRFWSRNSHWIDFDDTEGDEHIRLTSTTDNEAIVQDLNAAQKTIEETVQQDIEHEAGMNMTFKCTDFNLEASASVDIKAGTEAVFEAGASGTLDGGATLTCQAARIDINGGAPGTAQAPPATPTHSHPPTS